MKLAWLDKLREQNPVVLNISNFVTVQDVANGLNALGASPIMSEEIAETKEMVAISDAIALNLGSFTQTQIAHIKKMGQEANFAHNPIVLDPVAVGAISYRKQTALQLLQDFSVAVIRGNAGEIAALANFSWQAKGIDAGFGDSNVVEMAKVVAKKFHCIILMSGKTDYITDGNRVTAVHNGTKLFAIHVGSGDMLTSIVGAFAAVSKGDYFEAAQTAALVFAAIGELAAKDKCIGPGSFTVNLLDQLFLAESQQISAIADYEEL
ncbi:hydroxyethylthiazole kinase [Bombilactobacillus thymidiniphilus]|uniref:Hydroxyethylthiazole kinase n=1 Tax=Bombilactobacillus thymidiniphilus TaxID=2923363 RepID=A0ABY4PCI9_9LACO|nr:hydroxyethylthiazole kinase [Bombilactobacillus thymidiniphilus]UQS83417.1 hydroxyethylthiazole kinase [Bombilactobacillus thymidiniphilus]